MSTLTPKKKPFIQKIWKKNPGRIKLGPGIQYTGGKNQAPFSIKTI